MVSAVQIYNNPLIKFKSEMFITTAIISCTYLMHAYYNRESIDYGGLPSGMTKEQFFDGISKPINATLMRIFLNMGLTEHTGHGIPTIVEKYGTEVFEIESNFIRCMIPLEKEVIDQINSKNVGLNKTEKKVIELLIENPSATSIELAEKVGVIKRTIERIFKSLKEKKIIERIGSKQDGNWIVVR